MSPDEASDRDAPASVRALRAELDAIVARAVAAAERFYAEIERHAARDRELATGTGCFAEEAP